jgi:ABC-type nitrate/sulfonate/bicarbonate transport system ATPase subunit
VKPVLQLKGVGKTYRRGDEQVHVLVDFDFTLDAGEFVVVTGPSGAGKSTLLHIAGGLDAPDNGTVAVTGQDVWSMSTRARRVPAAQPRIRVPVLQLGANADRRGERVVAAGARRCACPISRRMR